MASIHRMFLAMAALVLALCPCVCLAQSPSAGGPDRPGAGESSDLSTACGMGACQLCADECTMAGYDAIEFIRVGSTVDEKGEPMEGSGFLAPSVREDRCVGCGLCQMRCHAINVKARKLLPHSAIRVAAGEGKEDRILCGSYVALQKEHARWKPEEKASGPSDQAGNEYLPDFLK